MGAGILSPEGCKARYGLSYVRSICSQAGVTMQETSADEDLRAVDCTLDFPETPLRVQVKCTSKWKIGSKSITLNAKPQWIRKWDENVFPVYLIVVIVPNDIPSWLRHDKDGTFHATAAFWARLVPGEIDKSIPVPKSQRFTTGTLDEWGKDLRDIIETRFVG